MVDEAVELLSAAVAVARTHPRAAARLRAWAMPPERPDPKKLRRIVLQRLWRTHLRGLSRTAAARVLAALWAAWRPGDEGLPGSAAEGFRRLYDVGIRPVSARTIVSDLDASIG